VRTITRLNGNKDLRAINVTAILKGVFFAFLVVSVSSIGLTVLSIALDWDSSPALLRWASHLSVSIGAFVAGRASQRKKWLHGALVGVGFLLIMTWLNGEIAIMKQVLWIGRAFSLAAAGIIGAIIGGFTD